MTNTQYAVKMNELGDTIDIHVKGGLLVHIYRSDTGYIIDAFKEGNESQDHIGSLLVDDEDLEDIDDEI